MSNNIVFFFETSKLYVTNVTYDENNIRGYCIDGCWSLNYTIITETVNVCIGRAGAIHWNEPIHSYKAKLVAQVQIPDDISKLEYLKIIKWAKNERDKKVA